MQKRKYSILLALLCLAVTAWAQLPTTGLVAHYPFDGDYLDASGNGHHSNGMTGWDDDRFGNPIQALYLAGGIDSLILPITGFTPLAGDFSISFWMKSNQQTNGNFLALGGENGDTTGNFHIKFFENTILQTILEIQFGAFIYWESSGAILDNRIAEGGGGKYQDGTWRHFAVLRTGTELQFWVNSVLWGQATCTGTLGSAIPFILAPGPRRFHGSVDDLAFYDRALSPLEVAKVFHEQRPYVIKSPKPTDAYPLDSAMIVQWQADTNLVSDSIDIQLSTDAGATWTQALRTHLEFYTATVPLNFPIGTTFSLRILDAENTAHSAEVHGMTISPYVWESLSSALPFTPRDGSGLLNFRDSLWLIGGWDPPYHEATYNVHNEVWASDDGINWHAIDTLAYQPGDTHKWNPRHCSGWVVQHGKIWTIGGDPQSGNKSDVWSSEDMRTWHRHHDTIPGIDGIRALGNAFAFNGMLMYMGGYNTYSRETKQDVYTSTDGDSWSRMPNFPAKGRNLLMSNCIDPSGNMWLLGGGHVFDRTSYNEVWRTNDGVIWECRNANAPWAPRYWHNVAWFDGHMWIMAGMAAQTEVNETWYSADGITWHELKGNPYHHRHGASSAVYNNALHLMCGVGSNDAWRLINTQSPPAKTSPAQQPAEPAVILFPNPSDGHLSADQPFQQAAVIDMQGRTLLTTGPGTRIDASQLPDGTYIVRLLRNARHIQSTHIVIQR